MSSTKKTIIAILTFLPIVFMTLYFVQIFSFVMNIETIERPEELAKPEDFMRSFVPMFIYILLTVITSLGMMIFYIIDITKNPKFQDGGNNKLIWILVVVLTSMLGMIAYFFVEIYPRKELPPLPKDGYIS